MQISQVEVESLFGRYDHTLKLPTNDESDSRPSIAIIHGPNGVGKTTILRMLHGFMELDFTVFRDVPFATCALSFSDGSQIRANLEERAGDRELHVSFDGRTAILSGTPGQRGPSHPSHAEQVEDFRKHFFDRTRERDLTMRFLDTSRAASHPLERDESRGGYTLSPEGRLVTINSGSSKRRPELATQVREFILEAQVDYRRYFTSDTSAFIPQLIDRLSDRAAPVKTPQELRESVRSLEQQDRVHRRLGLGVDPADIPMLMSLLDRASEQEDNQLTLTVLETQIESLLARADQRQALADRLLKFEAIMKDFFYDKTVTIAPRSGFTIEASSGGPIEESQLSSGEYQLLYLMVSALTTTRRGTVLAIDEPELSMHVKWQRKLIRNLVDCASGAAPQFIFATHSPDFISTYREHLIALDALYDKAPAD